MNPNTPTPLAALLTGTWRSAAASGSPGLPTASDCTEIEWTAEKGDRFMVKIFLRGSDRRGLLPDVSKAISDTGTNIQHADMRATDGGMNGVFVVDVQDLPHLRKVVKAVSAVKGVISVERRESFEEADLVER